ncbi:MAG: FAD-dependent oxidoreductase [Pseudomonadota bacterium]
MKEKADAVLVIGAGIGGIKAALELADAGRRVYLIDRSPAIGGTLAQLDKWFPDNHCGLCKIIPFLDRDLSSHFCLRRELYHSNIETFSYAQVEEVRGEAPNFQVTVNLLPRYVDVERCTGCGLCANECHVEVSDEFDEGLKRRKAIYIKYPHSYPNVYTIEMNHCDRCGVCVEVCPTKAIDLNQTGLQKGLSVGAIILSGGFEEFDPTRLAQYGYGLFPNVVTNLEFERILSGTGPYHGNLIRPSDGVSPKKIAFLQCIGSRDTERNYCSSACCMYAVKEARLTKRISPEIHACIFYMDMRAFGKGYYRYYEEAKREDIDFIRCRIPIVKEDPITKNLIVYSVNEAGNPKREEFDMVVLSVGQRPHSFMSRTSEMLGIELNKWGFCKTGVFEPVETSRKGVFVCGSVASPKDITDTIIEAGAAALKSALIVRETDRDMEDREPVEGEPRIGIFVCECGGDISSVIDVSGLIDYCRGLEDVKLVGSIPYLCLPEGISEIQEKIHQDRINRIVLGACVPYKHERKFRSALYSAGIDPLLTDMVNLREHMAWVHKGGDREGAQEKARALIRSSWGRIRLQEPTVAIKEPIKHRALVIGGGISGLTSALSIAKAGFEVDIIEKEDRLGGNLRHMHIPVEDGGDPQTLLKRVLEEVESHSLIHIYTNARVQDIHGYMGNFTTVIESSDSEALVLEHGAIVLATGGSEHIPNTYRYNESDRIITQREFERGLYEGDPRVLEANVVVMIQCVESRDENRSYCSRICCREAIHNAIGIKEKNEKTSVYILNRDIMTYGFSEENYRKARDKGIMFLRYNQDKRPEVDIYNGKVLIALEDLQLGIKFQIEADLLILSTGIDPADNRDIARLLNLELTEDGFFKEAEPKFRPLEMPREGIYSCGLAHSPRDLKESIAQGLASAQRVVALLSKKEMRSGRIIARVTGRKCAGCELCVSSCPYDARAKDTKKGVVIVREALCQGCGSCIVACPNGATKLVGFDDKQVINMMDDILV